MHFFVTYQQDCEQLSFMNWKCRSVEKSLSNFFFSGEADDKKGYEDIRTIIKT